ncbi:MAG: heparinase II/III family protein, partial [Planctomycetota bacterium]
GGPHAHIAGATVALNESLDWSGSGRSALERFHLHYMEYLEALDDERFTQLVLDWIERNPHARAGSWRTGWNSYVIAVRAVVWMQQLAERGPGLRAGTRRRIEGSLLEQLARLASHLERDIVGNHLIKDAKALLWAARYFEGPTAREWGALATRILLAELEEQVLPDGMHYERSPSYHAQVFADLVECASIARGELRARLLAKLEPMAQVLSDLSHPDGLPCLFNDAGLHTSYSPDECLRAWESVCGGRVRRRALFSLPDAGYFGLRAGDSLLVADCGVLAPAHLPAHGHGDVLSFEWSLGGQRIFVDAGVAQYEPGALRDEARATASHNTLTIDGADQAEFWSSFRVGRRPHVRVLRHECHAGGFVLEGEHDGFRHLPGAPLHRRRIVATPRTLVFEDEVIGGRGQHVEARLLLHPDVKAVVGKERLAILRCGDLELVVETRGALRVERAWWSPDIGVRIPTSRLVIELPPAPCRGVVRIQRIDRVGATDSTATTLASAA